MSRTNKVVNGMTEEEFGEQLNSKASRLMNSLVEHFEKALRRKLSPREKARVIADYMIKSEENALSFLRPQPRSGFRMGSARRNDTGGKHPSYG